MESDIENLRNEVYRKIGRNLLNFQRLETFMKFLVAHAAVHSESLHPLHNQNANVEILTMGQLKNRVSEKLWRPPEDKNADIDFSKIGFAFKFFVQGEPAFYLEKESTLAELVRERNDLVHHFAEKTDLKSTGGCLAAIDYLEEQNRRCVRESAFYLDLIKSRQNLFETLHDFMQSDEFQIQMDILLNQNPDPIAPA